MSGISPEILASQLVPETLKEQEISAALEVCNLNPLQLGIVHALLERMMADGIETERALNAGAMVLTSYVPEPAPEAVEFESALVVAEMNGYTRGFSDAFEEFHNRRKDK